MSLLLLVAAVVILGLVIGLTMLFNGLLRREDLPPWLAGPLAFIAAVVVVVGVAWAVLVAVCSGSGSGFH